MITLDLFKSVIDLLLQILKIRKDSRYAEKQIQKVVDTYDAMLLMSSLTDIHRVLILKIENSGGLIDPKVPIYATVIHEDYREPTASVKSRYIRLPVDQDYVRTIHSAITDTCFCIKVSDMAEGLLKVFYKHEGIKAAEICYLGSNSKAIFIMSVASATTDAVFTTDEYKANRLVAINNIKRALWN